MHPLRLHIQITDPTGVEVSHKLIPVRAANESGAVRMEGVVFKDRIPSGSFCALMLLNGDTILSSEKKIIPDSSFYQEGAQIASAIIDDARDAARSAFNTDPKIEKLRVHPFRQQIDVWVRLLIDDKGAGNLLCHVGNPGENQPKAVFEAAFSL